MWKFLLKEGNILHISAGRLPAKTKLCKAEILEFLHNVYCYCFGISLFYPCNLSIMWINYNAQEDLQPTQSFVVHAGEDSYPIGENIKAISIREMTEELASVS